MDRKRISLAMISAALLSLMIAAATASFSVSYTPLYTLRMEQVSSENSFLPTLVNPFTYSAEEGYTLNYGFSEGCCGATPLSQTFQPTCEFYNTCDETCSTCPNTCWQTCQDTCPNSCSPTCPNTCPSTCPSTCLSTCPYTCSYTCGVSCKTGC